MKKNNSRYPDFLVIGAGKSGTTSIDKYFNQHPDIFMARKEPCYFAIKNFESINDPNDKEQMLYYPDGVIDTEEYLHLFDDAIEGQLLGEVSPIYLNSEVAPVEIKKAIPEAKMIAILRHPAERLYSRYLHLASEFQAPDINLLFDRESIWHKRNDYVKEGYYAKNLKRFYDLFREDQLKVILFEDFKVSPMQTMSELYEFVGANSEFEPDMTIQYNKSGFIKNRYLDKLYGKDGFVNKLFKKANPNIYYKLKSNPLVYKTLLKLRGANMESPPLTLDLKRKITEEFYYEDIKSLEVMLNRSLKSWYEL